MTRSLPPATLPYGHPDFECDPSEFISRVMSNIDGGKDAEIGRLRAALERIDAVAVSKKSGALGRMQRIAREALAPPLTPCTCGADDGDPLDHHDISCPLAVTSHHQGGRS